MQRLASLLFAVFLSSAALSSAAAADGIEVDLELIMMVDVSRSMTERELEIQRRGYAAALRSDAIYRAIQRGLLQRVALSYVEWSGTQEVIVDWRVIENPDDLNGFADGLTSTFDPALRRTAISEALVFGAQSIEANAYDGLRRVIDISGDGPNNLGRPVTEARDQVLARGIVINGLPLMTREGMGSHWHLEDLDVYYRSCVVGGPGSFVIPVLDWSDFAEAVKRKLVLEIAGVPAAPLLKHAQYTPEAPYDCLIGEKIWEERRRIWDTP